MRLISLELESKLRDWGFWPQSWTAWASLYVLALDLTLFAAQLLLGRFSPKRAKSLEEWVTFLSALAIVLLSVSAYRWLRTQLLWRLRNRLIVTYVFIGVIPVFLLVVISLITLYLLAGQFASFVVTSDITTHLRAMEAANRAIAHQLATEVERGTKLNSETLGRARPHRPEWSQRQVCAWSRGNGSCSAPAGTPDLASPSFVAGDFRDIVSDQGKLYLRTAAEVPSERGTLRVILSEPLDREFVENISGDLGHIAVYGTDVRASKLQGSSGSILVFGEDSRRHQTFAAGNIPASSGAFDHEITFPIPLPVVDWASGERNRAGALAEVETRPSVLYARLFAALGDYAVGVEYILLSIAIIFAIIELFALFIGTRLTRSITSSVAQLYEATKHINRADFSHRIPVRSNDQLATLANSFNSMTTSIEKLVQEQKEKQRMEGELAIAQEVQAQLYPKLITQLDTLEVHGFCRPARTVSGDYYDFLALDPRRMVVAVGDISGKGISAALLMATIHSAVRAYSTDVAARRVLALPGAPGNSEAGAASPDSDISPATLLSLLNHQLYESTPTAKYATLFLGLYDGSTRRLTYSNGGHLHPIVIAHDGSAELLRSSGTVVGLFDDLTFPEASVELHPGDLFVAYSDGVTEPENDYGEFGEQRLIELVRDNRQLPLDRITELVTTAVTDWIGDNEQPDDVTLVLARAR